MKAARIEAFGDPVALRDIDRPTPGPGQVLLRIAACGLNFADLLMMKGTYQDTPEPPFTLGMEVAGVVEAHGEGVGVTGHRGPGRRLRGVGRVGGVRRVRRGALRADPRRHALQEAAGFLIAYGTSHLALTRRARLQAGRAPAGPGRGRRRRPDGGGAWRAMGAEVIAVARGADKLEAARRPGRITCSTRAASISGGGEGRGGADVVYDAVGGDMFKDAMRATNPEGRILVIGFASGEMPQIAPNHLLVKNIDVIGFYWGGYMRFGAEHLSDSLSALMADVRRRAHQTAYRRDPAAVGLRRGAGPLRRPCVAGKIVVTMNG
jgi:NADPH2:quinone reductase